MKRFELLLAGSLAAVLLSPPPAGAEVPYKCGTGTLRDVDAVIETFPAERHTRVVTKINKRGERETHADTSSGERHEKMYTVTVQLEDMSYTAQSSGNFWNFDPTRLVINDPIGLCVDRNQIILRRPDGKDYKARIVRAVRTQASNQEGGRTPFALP
jgi:hypothetical protein